MDERLKEAQRHAADGMQALQTANGPAALAAFTRATELGWPGPDVWIALSHARTLTGDQPGRTAALEKALQIDPGNVRALLYLGNAHAGRQNRPAAEQAYRAAYGRLSTLTARTQEIDQLLAEASAYLGEAPPQTDSPLDRFAKDHNVGADPEDHLFRQSLDMLAGRARPQLSRPTRYYYPGLPNREFYPDSAFEWTEALAAKTPVIRAELQALLQRQTSEASGFAPYVEAQGREGAGVSHPLLDNPEWSAFYLIKQGRRMEDNIALCPQTMAAVDAIGPDVNPAPAPSVLFSLLKPGARIPPHHGQFNTRLICHLPIILPGGCAFRVGNETREWKDGEVFIFDDTIEHEAWNNSRASRYVLIFEIWRPELKDRQRQLVTSLFDMANLNADG